MSDSKGPSVSGKRSCGLGTTRTAWGGTSWLCSQEPQEPQGFFRRPGHPRPWLGALDLACLLKSVGQGSGRASTAVGYQGEVTFLSEC